MDPEEKTSVGRPGTGSKLAVMAINMSPMTQHFTTLIESRTCGILLRFQSQNTAFISMPEGLNEVTIGIVAGKHLILTIPGLWW